MNVLVTSISKKVPLLKAVRKALGRISKTAKVYGGDMDEGCIGRYFSDFFWKMPPTSKLSVSRLSSYCHAHDITTIIPTRDGELSSLAAWRKELQKAGISVMVSSPKAVSTCLDKLKFYSALRDHSGLWPIFSATAADDFDTDRYVVKERFGSGSRSVATGVIKSEAIAFSKGLKAPLFQPYICGREYSVDLFMSRKGVCIGGICRSRDRIVGGESQITTTARFPRALQQCITAAEHLSLRGHLVFQGIIDDDQIFHLVECNPRFGGASTLGIAAGLDSFFWFLRECRGEALSKNLFEPAAKPLRQVRYADDRVVAVEESKFLL